MSSNLLVIVPYVRLRLFRELVEFIVLVEQQSSKSALLVVLLLYNFGFYIRNFCCDVSYTVIGCWLVFAFFDLIANFNTLSLAKVLLLLGFFCVTTCLQFPYRFSLNRTNVFVRRWTENVRLCWRRLWLAEKWRLLANQSALWCRLFDMGWFAAVRMFTVSLHETVSMPRFWLCR